MNVSYFSRWCLFALAFYAVLGLGCSSAPSANNSATSEAAKVEITPSPVPTPLPPSALMPAEFQEQAKVLDRYCVEESRGWKEEIQETITRIKEKTGKTLTPREIYTTAARLAPEMAKDENLKKDADGKFLCGEVLMRAILELVPEVAASPTPHAGP